MYGKRANKMSVVGVEQGKNHPSFQILNGLGLRILKNALSIKVRCVQAEW
jgi:hypothetical protein